MTRTQQRRINESILHLYINEEIGEDVCLDGIAPLDPPIWIFAALSDGTVIETLNRDYVGKTRS